MTTTNNTETPDQAHYTVIDRDSGEISVTVVASRAEPSTCTDVPGAVDVDVTVTLGTRTIEGEVTLAPAQYDGRLAPFGTSPDQWISGGLLAELYAACERATGSQPGQPAWQAWLRSAFGAIKSAAIEAE